MSELRLALNADTTPLSMSDTLIFKSTEERAKEAYEAGFMAVNVDRAEKGLTPEKAKQILDKYGLQVASGFFHGAFYLPEESAQLYKQAVEQAEFSQVLGQDTLFASALVAPPERFAMAGRIQPASPLSLNDEQFERMARLLERIGRLWQKHGITLCYHPHVATYVEAPHEIKKLMELTDPSLVRFGLDTGHIFFGGGDPIELIDHYFLRLGALHIKDVRADVVIQVRDEGLDYRQACAQGVWTEIGRGDIDFPTLFKMLRDRKWSGWVIVETDHTDLPTALESSRLSRRYLKEEIGL